MRNLLLILVITVASLGLADIAAMQRRNSVPKASWTTLINPYENVRRAQAKLLKKVEYVDFVQNLHALVVSTVELVNAVECYLGSNYAYIEPDVAADAVPVFDRVNWSFSVEEDGFTGRLKLLLASVNRTISSQGTTTLSIEGFADFSGDLVRFHTRVLSMYKAMTAQEVMQLAKKIQHTDRGYVERFRNFCFHYPWFVKSWVWSKNNLWLSTPLGLVIFAQMVGLVQSSVCGMC